MKSGFHGAAGGEVTGSAYLVQTRHPRVLVDSGRALYSPEHAEAIIPRFKAAPYQKPVTDSAREAVEPTVRSQPPAVRARLKP